MSLSQFKDPYHVEVLDATLVSANGKKTIDLRDYMLSISIVEDIYTSFIHCEINIFDHTSLSVSFPLIGEESFNITFATDNQEPSSYTFLLYKNISGGFNDTSKMQYYTLLGVSYDKVIDSALTISKSYSGLSYGGIVDDIFKNYFSKLNKKYFIEPTLGIQKFIAPGLSPFETIELCRRRSIPSKEPYSPYVFFQNQDGFYYISLNTLFQNSFSKPSSQILHCYVQNISNSWMTGEDGSVSPLNRQVIAGNSLNDVMSFDVVEKYNTIDKIKNNVYSGRVRYFDITTKSFSLGKDYNINQHKDKFILGNLGGEFNSPNFINQFLTGKSFGPTIIVDSARVFDGSTIDYLPDAYGSMKSYIELLIQEKVHVNIYGDNLIKAGNMFRLGAVLPSGKIDPTVGGNYLVSVVKHLITFDVQPRLVNALECIRGDFTLPIGEIPNVK